ncbi:transposase [Acidithiobacillus sp. AMEEHan]|uniref:IS110 family transposase n=1 Tax=Acidithiobacillus sp. AMEEHan TaxID=2994951 RepID=UPI0027E5762F|nr:transposase [Acidithiobacillus sp. AMEEHan]
MKAQRVGGAVLHNRSQPAPPQIKPAPVQAPFSTPFRHRLSALSPFGDLALPKKLAAAVANLSAPPKNPKPKAGFWKQCQRLGRTSNTGGLTFLAQQQLLVSVVNPAQIHAFGKAELSRAKMDKADARLIARFCRMHRPAPWVGHIRHQLTDRDHPCLKSCRPECTLFGGAHDQRNQRPRSPEYAVVMETSIVKSQEEVFQELNRASVPPALIAYPQRAP